MEVLSDRMVVRFNFGRKSVYFLRPYPAKNFVVMFGKGGATFPNFEALSYLKKYIGERNCALMMARVKADIDKMKRNKRGKHANVRHRGKIGPQRRECAGCS